MDREFEVGLDSGRARLRHEIAGIAMHLAALRFWWTCIKANFNPAQPRVPAGSPDGGQWTGDEGTADRPVRLAEDRKRRYTVFLQDQEGIRGSHTIREHVGKTDAQLMERMETGRYNTSNADFIPLRNGSFRTLADANDLVNRVLEDNKDKVDAVASNHQPDDFLNKRFGFPTGREALRETPYSPASMRTTYEVGVYSVYDPAMPDGFRVHTAYPRNNLPGQTP